MHPEDSLNTTQTRALVQGSQNLLPGGFRMSDGLGVWMEATPALLTKVGLYASLTLPVFDHVDTLME